MKTTTIQGDQGLLQQLFVRSDHRNLFQCFAQSHVVEQSRSLQECKDWTRPQESSKD